MLRKAVAVVVLGLLVVWVLQSSVLAEGRPGGRGGRGPRIEGQGPGTDGDAPRAEGPEGRRKGAGKLPEWKKRAIQRIMADMRAKIKRVRENDELTPQEKKRRIQHIRKVAHQKIRRILHAGRKPHGGGGDGAEGGNGGAETE